jgi:RNA polymerase sigma-70 factor (ECF subfamily)
VQGSDDGALLRAWRCGDARAGGALLRRYTSTVYRFFLTKTDPSTAEELTQATFEACTRKSGNIEGLGVRAFLLGIAYKKLLQHRATWVRRGSRQVAMDRSLAADCTSPSLALFREQRLRLVLHALQQLPLELQIAVELYYWEDLPIKEVAQVLEIAPGTVKSRLAHARDLLRHRIGEAASGRDPVPSTAAGLQTWIRSVRDAHEGAG